MLPSNSRQAAETEGRNVPDSTYKLRIDCSQFRSPWTLGGIELTQCLYRKVRDLEN